MRLRLNNSGPTPLREQLTAQIVLAIAAGDLKPGDRLPTTRELARRHRIHPNTVSAAYRELVDQGWVESHKGSGVYVSDKRGRKHNPDTLVSELLAKARSLGISQPDLEAHGIAKLASGLWSSSIPMWSCARFCFTKFARQ